MVINLLVTLKNLNIY